MKNALIILALMLFYSALSFGQNNNLIPIIEDFAFMQGNWSGVLAYTDYQDDKTKVELKTTRTYSILDKKMWVHTTFIEPDGVPVYDKDQINITKKGDKINFGGEIMVFSEKSNGRVVLVGEGEDNNKKSLIRETIDYAKDALTLTKEVQYEGTTAFLMRHQFRFQRESEDSIQARLLKQATGTWELDLRPSPESSPYLKDFVIKSFTNSKLLGEFYGTSFTDGKINTAWGKLYFSFTTADQSGVYYHSGYLDEGRLYGSSLSEARGFMIPWFSTKRKS